MAAAAQDDVRSLEFGAGDFKDPHGWIGRALEDLRQKEHVLMVLHDARPESMAHLEDFLRQVGHSEIAQKISLTGRVMK